MCMSALAAWTPRVYRVPAKLTGGIWLHRPGITEGFESLGGRQVLNVASLPKQQCSELLSHLSTCPSLPPIVAVVVLFVCFWGNVSGSPQQPLTSFVQEGDLEHLTLMFPGMHHNNQFDVVLWIESMTWYMLEKHYQVGYSPNPIYIFLIFILTPMKICTSNSDEYSSLGSSSSLSFVFLKMTVGQTSVCMLNCILINCILKVLLEQHSQCKSMPVLMRPHGKNKSQGWRTGSAVSKGSKFHPST